MLTSTLDVLTGALCDYSMKVPRSSHYHPWIDQQGQSPFVWSVIGGIAQTTQKLTLGTGVTCPTMRIHPAIIAQAALTSATLMPERFFLGVGTGENLNEHILGDRWPAHDLREAMLEEAVDIIRMLGRRLIMRREAMIINHRVCQRRSR